MSSSVRAGILRGFQVAALLSLGAVVGAIAQGSNKGTQPAERVTGIGGVFIKSKDPGALSRWYQQNLGFVPQDGLPQNSLFFWRDREDPARFGTTVWAVAPQDSSYFGSGGAGYMISYRVRNLDAMMAQLKARGVLVEPRVADEFNGRFAWLTDPDGRRVELWEPKAGF